MKYQKGQTGNPNGRPKGLIPYDVLKACQNQFTAIAIEEATDWAPKIIRKALEMAAEGNERMITMLWDKFFDIKRDHKINQILGTRTAAQIADSEDVVIAQLACNKIDIDYALGLMKALAVKRESIIVRDLESYVNMQKERESHHA